MQYAGWNSYRLSKAALICTLLFGWATGGLFAGEGTVGRERGPRLVRLHTTSRELIGVLERLGVDIASIGRDYVDILLKPGTFGGVEGMIPARLRGAVSVEVLSEDPEAELRARFEGKADAGAYHTYEETKALLKRWEQEYPSIAKVVKIGTSVEGRDILALKISDDAASDEGEPGFLVVGLHHSREWISVEVPLALARTLLEGYGGDERITGLVNEREIWIVPVMNPDGLVYSQTRYRMWRKNRRKNPDGSYGVDPNRNYEYHWGEAGASSYPGSDTYRGPSAASEPEVQAIENFARTHPNLKCSVSYHSYGQLILWPWSYTSDEAPDDAILGRIAKGMAALNGYTPEQSSDLYPASGDFDDFMYGVCGLASFTIELGTSFIPDESRIEEICARNVKALLWLIENQAEPFPPLLHTPPATAAGPGPHEMVVKFNKKHHPDIIPFGLKMVWKDPSGATHEAAMEADENGETFKASLATPQPGTYEYHFEMAPTHGATLRLPEKGEFELKVVDTMYIVIDDDRGGHAEKYYVEALEACDVAARVVDRSRGLPSLAELKAADGVIWVCGAASSGTLKDDDRKLLTEYLEGGGVLMVSGQDIGYELKQNEFMKKWLKAAYKADKAKAERIVTEDGAEFVYIPTDGIEQSYPDVLEPLDGARAFAEYRDSSGKDAGCAVVAVDAPTYRLLYCGIGVEGLNGADQRASFMKKALEWLGKRSELPLMALVTATAPAGNSDAATLEYRAGVLAERLQEGVIPPSAAASILGKAAGSSPLARKLLGLLKGMER